MTRRQFQRAVKLADQILAATKGMPVNGLVAALRRQLTPMPTMGEILLKVPGETVTERAATIGCSRQGYYNLLAGTARPNPMTAKRLADLTGIEETVIREIW